MKIHFFCHSVHPHGTYFRWHNLGLGLVRLGHEVTVFAVNPDPGSRDREERRDGLRYRISPGVRGNAWFSPEQHPFTALRRCVRDYGASDVAHLFQPFLTAAAPWWLRSHGVRFYDWDDLWENGLAPASASRAFSSVWRQRRTIGLERSLPSRCVHLTTCSQTLLDMGMKRGAPAGTVILNGFWPTPHPTKAEARRGLHLEGDAVYLGFMGRTITRTEREWLFGLPAILPPGVRLAVCGIPADLVREHVSGSETNLDYRGILSTEECKGFAAALDLALMPLEDAPLNRCRAPIKFADYLAAGVPVVCSSVGECAARAKDFPFVLPAVPTRAGWNAAVLAAVDRALAGRLPPVDMAEVRAKLSWLESAQKLAATYQASLADETGIMTRSSINRSFL